MCVSGLSSQRLRASGCLMQGDSISYISQKTTSPPFRQKLHKNRCATLVRYQSIRSYGEWHFKTRLRSAVVHDTPYRPFADFFRARPLDNDSTSKSRAHCRAISDYGSVLGGRPIL